MSNVADQSLVDDAKHGDHVDVLRLGEELREDSDVIDHPLGVRVSHRTIQEVVDTLLSTVVVTYTRVE